MKATSRAVYKRSWRQELRVPLQVTMLLAPAVLLVGAIFLYPILFAIRMSLGESGINAQFWGGSISLSNFIRLFGANQFWNALLRTLVYTVLVTGLSFAVGLVGALAIQRLKRGGGIFRTAMALPWVVPPAIAAMVWRWIADAQVGVLNEGLFLVGLPTPNWLMDSKLALIAVVVVAVWSESPFFLIMCSAGLQMIPRSLYEAAMLDGATGIQQLRHITLPGLRPITTVALVLSALMSIRHYDIPAVLTGGGPNGATETLALLIYRNAFQYFRVGYASAIGVVSLILSVAIVVIFLRQTRGART